MFRRALAIVAMVAAAPMPTGAAAPPLSILEAVALAELNHPRVAGMQARVKGVEARRREVEGATRPQVELQAVHVDGLSGAKGAGLGVQGIVSSQLVADNAAGVNISQRLYDSGELRSRDRALSYQAASARSETEAARRQVGLEATRAFVEMLKQDALLAIYRDLLRDRQAFAAQAESYLRAGLRTGIDASLAKIQVARARGLVSAAENRRSQAWSALRRALGETSLAGSESTSSPRELLPVRQAPRSLPSAASLLQAAQLARPEVVAAQEAVDAARAEVQAVRATRKPQVVGFLSGGAANTARSPDGDLEWAGGVAVKLPLDVSSVYGERIAQAQARLLEAEARLLDVRQQTTLEVNQALADMENLRQQQEVDLEELEQARAALKVSDSQYRAGLGTFLDRLQAENAVIEARGRLREREFDSVVAWTRLQVARGAAVREALIDCMAGEK
ncbi:MAG: TolC family protein [Candidatus Wallbacteria bacterium]|nr:TolC family protein [Candidatus Wallbacteria bacterium]